MSGKCIVNVNSEIGELQGVIIHSPGHEIENMIPENVERALYSDILNLAVATKEYGNFKGALSKVTSVYEVDDLLSDILVNDKVKEKLIRRICVFENVESLMPELMDLDAKNLTRVLIEGLIMNKDTLTKYLDKNRYSLRPLHNFFFMRDASMSVFNDVLIGRMANKIRMRESMIMGGYI